MSQLVVRSFAFSSSSTLQSPNAPSRSKQGDSHLVSVRADLSLLKPASLPFDNLQTRQEFRLSSSIKIKSQILQLKTSINVKSSQPYWLSLPLLTSILSNLKIDTRLCSSIGFRHSQLLICSLPLHVCSTCCWSSFLFLSLFSFLISLSVV